MVLKGVYDFTSEIENGWIVFVVATIAAGPSASQDLVPPLYVAPTVPSVAGLAFGRAPQFIGADEYITGPAPILRFQQPGSTRAVALLGTVFSANILDHPVLRTGPTGVYRLGRSDVDDEVVARLPEIDASIDLGWTLGAEYIDPENAARRIRADVNFRSVVTGSHVFGASALAWTPTPFFLLGAFAAVTLGQRQLHEYILRHQPLWGCRKRPVHLRRGRWGPRCLRWPYCDGPAE